jgi:hypothetical protein
MPTTQIALIDQRAARVLCMSTELNALANTQAAISSAVQNGTGLDIFVDFFLSVTFASAPTAGTALSLYLIRQDGTDYEDNAGGASGTYILPPDGYVGAFGPLRAVTSKQVLCLRDVRCPVLDFKLGLLNDATGQAMPASGSTVYGRFSHFGAT